MTRSTPQMFVFSHHKVGTVLFSRVLSKIARHFGMTMKTVYGLATQVDRSADIVLFAHSLVGFDLASHRYRGVHLRRDPRDVWVSGYLYHRHCAEKWCTNIDFSAAAPIRFPRVPLSLQHKPEAWKKSYLAGLGGKSYQQNLLDRDRHAGLAFELERYAGWTIEAMTNWVPRPRAIVEIPLEAFADNFDATMAVTLSHLGFAHDRMPLALAIAASEDTARMDDQRIRANPHIHSRTLSKWRNFLLDRDLAVFRQRHGSAVERLGYDRPASALHGR